MISQPFLALARPAAGVFLVAAALAAPQPWWSEAVESALSRAGGNRGQLESALQRVPAPERPWLAFLVEHLPPPDLEKLPAELLLENVELARQARERAPWSKLIPEDIFLNDVLPHAVINERRDAWRAKLARELWPIVADCKRPGEAARRLNERMFPLYGVRYSTSRKRADQSSLETIESKIATCTGLSVLLVDACRAVGVPARVAGTANWHNKRGNHTWVEVWDDGWHFLGAAEPDPNGLDRGWFAHDAAQAVEGSAEHGIFASSFRRTGTSFPMVWARRTDWVHAVEVTARYKPRQAARPATARLLVRAVDAATGKRIAAQVEVIDTEAPGKVMRGATRTETADLNDILAFDVAPARAYTLIAARDGVTERREARVEAGKELLIDFRLGAAGAGGQGAADRVRAEVERFFAAPEESRAALAFPPELDDHLAADEPGTRAAVWQAYRSAPMHDEMRADHAAGRVRGGAQESPYTLKRVGEKAPGGWGLMIALHGGGGVPRAVNDSQWQVMQRYYRDQAGVPGYLYVALRAPNDAWNGFYDDRICLLVEALIRQLAVCEDVDTQRVCLLGYSHGGYGAFVIGPKIPHRFAAVHSSAAAPTDGETAGRNLRSTRFTFMVGERDVAYGRLDRCRSFDALIQRLRGDRTDIYPVKFEFQAGFGHGGLPDRDKLRELAPATRDAAPRELAWDLTDGVLRHFFWVTVDEPGEGQRVEATCGGNRVEVNTLGTGSLRVHLDARLVDMSRPVQVSVDGWSSEHRLNPSLRVLCQTLLDRGDIHLAFTASIPAVGRTRRL